MTKTHKISLWKIENHGSIEAIKSLALDEGYREIEASDSHTFYFRDNYPTPPSWLDFVKDLLPDGQKEFRNYSCAFLYLTTCDGVLFALSGGAGYSIIQNYVDNDFGIEVAVRMIKDQAKIKSLMQRAFKGVVRQMVRNVENYSLNWDRENYDKVLNGVSGKGEFLGRTGGIIGKSSISFRTETKLRDINNVISKITRLLSEPKSIDIPKSFSVLNNPETIASAQNALVDSFNSYWTSQSGRENLYAEFDDPLTQFSCDRFSITVGGRKRGRKFELEDFDLDLIDQEKKDLLGLPESLSIEDIKKIDVYGYDSNGVLHASLKLYDMLVYDVNIDGKDYVKLGKRWFLIEQQFVSTLDEMIASMELVSDFPDWDINVHPKELDYNRSFASSISGQCLDQDLVHIGIQKIELCDVYEHTSKAFYHIKNVWGAKSSYLFLQGSTALHFYTKDAGFRNECSRKWPTIFQRKIKTGNVIFGIAMDPIKANDFPKNLTFFAKLNLVEACNRIRDLGFTPKIGAIKLT